MEKPIKVLQFSISENIGGIETFLRNLYKSLDKSEIQFDFVTTYDTPVYENEFVAGGAKMFRIPSPKRFISYFFAIRKIIKENDYKIIHVNKNSGADIVPFIVAKMLKVPVIIAHAHNTKSTVGKFADMISCINRHRLSKYITNAFASSREAAEWMFGEKYARTHEIPIFKNGINIADYSYSEQRRGEIRKRLSLGDKFVIGHVGKFSLRKNHDFLIDIFNSIHKRNKNSVLMLIGTGALMSDISQKVHKLGIQDAVIFMGAQNNINEYYEAMDAFVMPSLIEDLPVAAIEAQSTGLPVFLSDTIDQNTEITDSVKWLSLEQSSDIWADVIINTCECFERAPQDEALKKAGYDISEIADFLMKIYKKD